MIDFGKIKENATIGVVDNATVQLNLIRDSAISAKSALDALAAANAISQQGYVETSGVSADTTMKTNVTPTLNGNSALSTGESSLARTYNNQQLLYWAEYQKDDYILSRIENQLKTQNVASLKFLQNGMPEYTLEKFAKGGISNVPAIFGEAGAEAAVPLPDGRSIPVTLNRTTAQNDSSVDLTETVNELKESNRQLQEQNRKLSAAIQVMQEGFKQMLNENKKQTESLDTIEKKTAINARRG